MRYCCYLVDAVIQKFRSKIIIIAIIIKRVGGPSDQIAPSRSLSRYLHRIGVVMMGFGEKHQRDHQVIIIITTIVW